MSVVTAKSCCSTSGGLTLLPAAIVDRLVSDHRSRLDAWNASPGCAETRRRLVTLAKWLEQRRLLASLSPFDHKVAGVGPELLEPVLEQLASIAELAAAGLRDFEARGACDGGARRAVALYGELTPRTATAVACREALAAQGIQPTDRLIADVTAAIIVLAGDDRISGLDDVVARLPAA